MRLCQGRQYSHTITTITHKYDTQRMVKQINLTYVRSVEQIITNIDLQLVNNISDVMMAYVTWGKLQMEQFKSNNNKQINFHSKKNK